MIISLHMPKTAGSSFRAILKSHFQSEYMDDYEDKPLNQYIHSKAHSDIIPKACEDAKKLSRIIRILGNHGNKYQKECIHGHFLPYKYIHLYKTQQAQFITWLRDPLERLASHYQYWKRSYNAHSASFHKKIVEENWSFSKFVFSKEMQNLYTKFLWRFPLEYFDFVGITEDFDTDLRFFFQHYLQKNEVDIPHMNVNPQHSSYFEQYARYEELKEFHAQDYIIYNKALEMQKRRLQQSI